MSDYQEPHILMLHGYLHCISTICGRQYSFGASSFIESRDIDVFVSEFVNEWCLGDEYIPPCEYIYAGKKVIGYEELCSEVASYVFNGALKPLAVKKENLGTVGGSILWHLFEYYGLASTSLNQSGVFHPLVHGPVHRLDIRRKEHERALYFLVRIEDMYVLTHFLKWRNDENKT
jgi:hypothetical protein